MAKEGYCSECKRVVPLNPDDSCVNGHARSCIRQVRDTSSPQQPVAAQAPVVPSPAITSPPAPVGGSRRVVLIVAAAFLALAVIGVGLAVLVWAGPGSGTKDAEVAERAADADDGAQEAPEAQEPGADTVANDEPASEPVPTSESAPASDGGGNEPVAYIGAMAPTVEPGMEFQVDEQAYAKGLPEIGDIIYLVTNSGETGVRRVLGLPGDSIEIRKGLVVRNGKQLDEPYVKINDERKNVRATTVEDGAVYVIGDNRSMLGEAAFGPIPMAWVKGKITLP